MVTKKISVQLRAFCAAGYALFLSCTPSALDEPTCLGGNCTAIIQPIVETNSFTIDIDENNPKIQEFTLKIHATPTSPQWRYNGDPVVSAYWSGNLSYFVRHNGILEEVSVADKETPGVFRNGTMVITQVIGIPRHLSGKTLIVTAEIWWEAGEHTVVRNFSQNFLLK